MGIVFSYKSSLSVIQYNTEVFHYPAKHFFWLLYFLTRANLGFDYDSANDLFFAITAHLCQTLQTTPREVVFKACFQILNLQILPSTLLYYTE